MASRLAVEQVINHPDVEAVWLCSPSQFHAEQIKACADAGKHVFCEKPIATDLLETIDAVSQHGQRGVSDATERPCGLGARP